MNSTDLIISFCKKNHMVQHFNFITIPPRATSDITNSPIFTVDPKIKATLQHKGVHSNNPTAS